LISDFLSIFNIDGFVKSQKTCHCERSEAISRFIIQRLLRRFAPRNDKKTSFQNPHSAIEWSKQYVKAAVDKQPGMLHLLMPA
jgi:hypothetical protein